MTVERDGQRVLLAASIPQVPTLRQLFTHPTLGHWQVSQADSLERSRFQLQHDSWDILLLDESAWEGDLEGLAWVLSRDGTRVVLLLTPTPEVLTVALQGGVNIWLPRGL